MRFFAGPDHPAGQAPYRLSEHGLPPPKSFSDEADITSIDGDKPVKSR
jgi:hypothetical protein